MPKPMAILAKTLAGHAGCALRQYASGDRLSCSLSPSNFAELQPHRGDGAILTLQLPGERLDFATTPEGQPIDVILQQHLIGPAPSRAGALVPTVPGFRFLGYGQALGARGDLPMDEIEVMARFAPRHLHT
ncbi:MULTISPECIES: hypothetical protein [Rhizobium]|nr:MULTISPECIES: hypothetical protein [Rhizobium]MBO9178333.1 hypothetical protein [Rhizobium sp. 16-488-2a]KEA03076.1 hypothetical protein CN09_33835 [Rhizobium rhizogenes]MBO9194879.1 hypothetical protein [Rhizobium sp. 16-449-1b]NTI39568.1 hypothetical protein [Rhizobium rhizogenes]NTI72162.1 hypothetical protein [Rhizobium rhizogenes]